MLIPSLTARLPRLAGFGSGGLRRLRHYLAVVVMTTGRAQMMRLLQLAAIRAFGIGRRLQRMMRATHVAAGGRGFSLRDGHDFLKTAWGSCGYLAKFQGGGNNDRAEGEPTRFAAAAQSFGTTLLGKAR
jgi:hypothetical protein